MRKLLLSLVASAAMAGAFIPSSASAAVGSLPAVQPAIIDSAMVEDVQYRRCWHRGYSRWFCRYGGGYRHGWRRSRWRRW
jgi:hypothetical protein